MFNQAQGLQSIMKEGGKHLTGVEEAVIKNIEACRNLSTICRTSLGPNSMNKLIINHIEKHYVTSDAAVIVNELEVVHPAAKMVVDAAKMQEQEYGDATNFLVMVAGELLSQAEALLKMGLHTADIIKGFEMALKKAMELLPSLACWSVSDLKSVDQLSEAIQTALASKQFGLENKLARLVAEAAVKAMPSNPKDFDVDNVRVAKITGGSLHDSSVIYGMLVARDTNGPIKKKEKCKVLVLGCGLELGSTETKGTVLINNADELMNFTKGEEDKMEGTIKEIKAAGIDVIIASSTISDLGQHYCNKYDILVLKITSKFELRRVCRSLGATALVRLGAPLPEEIGHAEIVSVEEVASQKVTIIRARDSRVATVVLRGATPNVLEELERAIDDAVSCVRAVTRDPRFVPGAGATEMELSLQLQTYGKAIAGLDQYAILKFAEALEAVPRVLAENAGYKATEVITELSAAHDSGKKAAGVNVEGVGSHAIDAAANKIYDHMETKEWALRLAADAALTVLRVDQIIMAKPAGGPKPPKMTGEDGGDD